MKLSEKTSLQEGKAAFLQLRKEAQENGIQDISLDEINAEISTYRNTL